MVSANAHYGATKQVLRGQLVRQATAGTGQSTTLGHANRYSRVTEVKLTPAAAVAADADNNRIWTVYNRGQAGAGTTVLATLDTSTTAFVDNVARLMTLSATAADLEMAPGDQIEVVETVEGTGVAHGGMFCELTLSQYG